MALGELWPWGRWHGHAPPIREDYWPARHRIAVTLPTSHKCTVRTSPVDRRRWLTHCAACGYSTWRTDRDSALYAAVYHYHFGPVRLVNAPTEETL